MNENQITATDLEALEKGLRALADECALARKEMEKRGLRVLNTSNWKTGERSTPVWGAKTFDNTRQYCVFQCFLRFEWSHKVTAGLSTTPPATPQTGIDLRSLTTSTSFPILFEPLRDFRDSRNDSRGPGAIMQPSIADNATESTLQRLVSLLSERPIERLAYSYDDAAQVLGVDRQVIKRLHQSGKLRAKKVGRKWLISRSELLHFLSQ